MKKFHHPLKDLSFLAYRWALPFFDPLITLHSLSNYPKFFIDLAKYKISSKERISFFDTYPILHEKTLETPFDHHYFYQDIWAFKKIHKINPSSHVDIGSRIIFAGFLSVITKVIFIDIRPLNAKLKNLVSKSGNILQLPYKDNSIESMSCLHVVEHVGLGRYGDHSDPEGTLKACKELSRVLKRKGNLFLSTPIGKPRVCFNAHRIHSPFQIISFFKELRLVEFSAIDDQGNFIEKVDPKKFNNSDYSCGLFWFKK